MCVCNLTIYALSEIIRIFVVEMPKNNDIFHLSLDIISLIFEYPVQYVLRTEKINIFWKLIPGQPHLILQSFYACC